MELELTDQAEMEIISEAIMVQGRRAGILGGTWSRMGQVCGAGAVLEELHRGMKYLITGL